MPLEANRIKTDKRDSLKLAQLCGLAGVSKDTVNRLSAETASRVFRETMPGGNKPIQLFTTEREVRSIHGHSYTRLYNADLVAMLLEFAVDFQPPQKASTGGTGLYCGEQDLFAFLIDPTGWAEIGGEAFAPGFFVWNSEVGKRSVGIQTFWYESICQNHIVWDATEVVEFTRKHTGKVGEALSDIRRIVEEIVTKRDARRDGFTAVIKKAMEQTLGEDAEEAMKALTKNGIPRGVAKAAREGAGERGRPDRRRRKGLGPARPRGLTTIPWWLPSGQGVSGTEPLPGRLAREPSDPAKRLRGLVLWLW